ncbi:MAG: hypothetical protein PHI08_03725 [Bacteroidales bacterium]|nr:hypothetical protein [Bacteroidales bacterium]
MKNLKYSLILLVFLSLSLSFTTNEKNDYSSINHKGEKSVLINKVLFKDITVDTSKISPTGYWLMPDSAFYFIDKKVVSVKKFNLDGSFIGNKIGQGFGPNEIVSPAWISSVNSTGQLFIMDNNNILYSFDKNFSLKTKSNSPWIELLDSNFDDDLMEALYQNPDPKVPEMYEYNYVVNDMQSCKDTLYIPINTEHVSYNGYDTRCNSLDYWKNSYIFISFSINNITGTKHLFGHYPPVYYKQNIPVFSTYDFTIANNKLYITFAADPNIYVMNLKGELLYSMGIPDTGIKGEYPQTKTFDEYENKRKEQREKYGYYDKLYAWNNLLFRTCRLDNGKWKLQIYKGPNMVGDVQMDKPLRIFGNYNGYFYGYVDTDMNNEQFKLVKFKINI